MWKVTGRTISYENPSNLPMAFRELCDILQTKLTMNSKVTLRIECRFCTFFVVDGNYRLSTTDDLLTTTSTFQCKRAANPGATVVDQLADQVAQLPLCDLDLPEKIRACLRAIEEAVYLEIDNYLHKHMDIPCMIQQINEIVVDVEDGRTPSD